MCARRQVTTDPVDRRTDAQQPVALLARRGTSLAVRLLIGLRSACRPRPANRVLVAEDPSAGGVRGRTGPGTRTVLSRHNFRRTYHSAIAKLADPATQLRPTATRVLKRLRTDGPQTVDELVAALARQGRAIRPATIESALGELAASGLAAPAEDDGIPARVIDELMGHESSTWVAPWGPTTATPPQRWQAGWSRFRPG